MTVSILVDKVGAAPVWTGRQTRGMFSSLFAGKTAARPLGCRSGVAYGTPASTGSVSGTTWTIKPHAGAVDLESAAAASVYPYVNDADVTGSHNAAHASLPRIDIVCFHLDDPAEGDGSSVPLGSFIYTAGTAAASPVAPATPARSMALIQINVPASGGGASTVTWVAPSLQGGIIPVRNTTERDALHTAYPATTDAPLIAWRKDAAKLELNSGSGWKALGGGAYNYVWADAAARAAETGMIAGEKGYQTDTKIVYRYDGSAWKAWESDWTTYTPTMTNYTVGTGGSVKNVWEWKYELGLVHVRFRTVLGSSGFSVAPSSSVVSFALPVAMAALQHSFEPLNGTGVITSSTVSDRKIVTFLSDDSDVNEFRVYSVASPDFLPITPTSPHTWAAGSRMSGEFTYKPA